MPIHERTLKVSIVILGVIIFSCRALGDTYNVQSTTPSVLNPYGLAMEAKLSELLAVDGAISRFWQLGEEGFLEVPRSYVIQQRTDNLLRLHFRKFIQPVNQSRSILLLHGHSEILEKYRELSFDFYNQGYNVFFYSMRGHGYSDRLLSDPRKVHVDNFMDYVKDLNQFIKQVVQSGKKENLFLFAHSMGGAVGRIYVEEHPDIFTAAVLSSPMLQLNTDPYHEYIAKVITGVSALFWQGEKYAIGQGDLGDDESGINLAGTSSVIRYELHRAFVAKHDTDTAYPIVMRGSTNQWIYTALQKTKTYRSKSRAAKVNLPILLGSATADIYVKIDPQKQFCHFASNCTWYEAPNSRHELWFEVDAIRIPYLTRVLDFFGRF